MTAKQKAFLRAFAALKPRSGLVFLKDGDKVRHLETHLKAKNFKVMFVFRDLCKLATPVSLISAFCIMMIKQVASLLSATAREERRKALVGLAVGRNMLLLSTEMMSRGIDFPRLTHIFNFDVPDSAYAYLHRAGRVARASPTVLVRRDLTALERWADKVVAESEPGAGSAKAGSESDVDQHMLESLDGSLSTAEDTSDTATPEAASGADQGVSSAARAFADSAPVVSAPVAAMPYEREQALLDKLTRAKLTIDKNRGNHAVVSFVFPSELKRLKAYARQLNVELQELRLQ